MEHIPAQEHGISIYPITKVVSDYICNSLGEIGCTANPINYSQVNQILLSQWKYMKGMKELYTLVRMAKQGEAPMVVAQQAIASYNKRNLAELTFKEVSAQQLERPDNLCFSPQGDPWIFYKTRKEYSINDLLNLETPNVPGDITEYERHFLPLKDFMEILYFVDWNENLLMVVKSPFVHQRNINYDPRTIEEVKERFNIARAYYKFDPEFEGSNIGDVYTLSPELEQNIVMEMTHPELV